ncbi:MULTISPECIES: hydrogenase 4 subunit B [Rhodopseudomonas]|uniref:Hydrogenase 4 subunit B n=1 Tax=Rhodopseudomonas palustris TaxID=1076 RepID=A0A0D7EQR8_RHOPL|nr:MULTISPECIES: hydrogenase 4 subunit B [Rhodopseudomonas]KIZ43174.1 hydrogenase 4 subunit B [Rhodopseudomonas palustris]MDF3811859.1 hydrogenase 4 subunit B [Rhodopseudomonas sp. BAL398]WOK19743.1 hydrogenase 4 subunit B [Rhodopseudomonas sp. BAL398]
MTPIQLLCASLACSLVAACGSLLFARLEKLAIFVSGAGGLLAAVLGAVAGASVLSGTPVVLDVAGPFPFAHFILRLDALSGLMVLVISALSAVASIYSFSYVREYTGRGVGAMGFFFNVFVASMLLVVVADNAFWFLVFFEMMSLASYFLVIFDQDEEAVSAGFIYFLVAHAGSVAIMAGFFLMANAAGSMDFAAFRATHPSALVASIVFGLSLLGFGAKAGMIPLHVWLPRAHPAAPSHASALMSGVMIKIGVFGILKVGVDLLGGGVLWWGMAVLALGAISSVLGVIYALAEHDIKKLLAYHSVENIGIIMMGVGTGMIGLATHQPLVAMLGLLAGLYHLVNHAVFKGLLFLGAGAVIFRLHTKDMDKMGGLARTMPWTSACFLVGALAISAIPPLNGFVSEWFTYQALFAAALNGTFLVKFATPIAATALALTGALAVMCFVKAYGEMFSGLPRSKKAEQSSEVPAPMIIGMVLLAAACVGLGLAAPLVVPVIGGIAAAILHMPEAVFANGTIVIPGDAGRAALSTPLIALLLLGLATVPLVISAMFAGARANRRRTAEPWACGYLPDAQMTVTAHSFAQPIRMFFAPLYAVRNSAAAASKVIEHGFCGVVTAARRTEPMFDRFLVTPTVGLVNGLGHRVQVLQSGDLSTYCLYIVAALAALLLITLR